MSVERCMEIPMKKHKLPKNAKRVVRGSLPKIGEVVRAWSRDGFKMYEGYFTVHPPEVLYFCATPEYGDVSYYINETSPLVYYWAPLKKKKKSLKKRIKKLEARVLELESLVDTWAGTPEIPHHTRSSGSWSSAMSRLANG